MHQAVLVHADIDKGAKVGDVGHRAFEDHPRQQVVHGFHAIGELRGFKFRTRVAARFFQLFDDVGDGRHAETLVGKLGGFQTAEFAAVAHQIFQRLLSGRQNAFNHRVGFRVHGGSVQRVIAVVNAQEARALLERFRPQTTYLQQLLSVLELAVLIAPGDDVLRHHARQARDAGQQRHGGGVQIHADGVHAVFDDRVQLTRQLRLADVMLILAHTDGFRVDFHQLCQRIL